MRAHERIKEVETDSWTCGGAKKGHGRAGAAAGNRRHDVVTSGGGGTTWWGGKKPAGVGRTASW
jgi:hypothetical protein